MLSQEATLKDTILLRNMAYSPFSIQRVLFKIYTSMILYPKGKTHPQIERSQA
ncbi:MAG: hypothetical protein SCARUB_03914 [Candidatus Scalindua rubra]|uniref:Uncharacterized protein n=1 Tax=Candidatus Scalindua rubra TaxID=1872076 RepID=A0A1E3X7M7_9BACT|nr:MAG: hypothetical protein SCARUB_03914 [Candidatus Scalindua rubra]